MYSVISTVTFVQLVAPKVLSRYGRKGTNRDDLTLKAAIMGPKVLIIGNHRRHAYPVVGHRSTIWDTPRTVLRSVSSASTPPRVSCYSLAIRVRLCISPSYDDEGYQALSRGGTESDFSIQNKII